MAKQPVLTSVIPSRDFHDLSQSVYGTMSWGVLYPVYSRYFNAGDIVRIKPNIVVRTMPSVAPLFNRVDIRVHRFWCPRRLYHRDMRENSRQFDYTTSDNHIFTIRVPARTDTQPLQRRAWSGGGLLDWLNLLPNAVDNETYDVQRTVLNAEPAIAYIDIVRSFYGFSKMNCFSFMSGGSNPVQNIDTLDKLDDFVEGVYNLKGRALIGDDTYPGTTAVKWPLNENADSIIDVASVRLDGLAVAPSSPDGLSRFIPSVSTDVVTITSPITIPSLAVSSRVQAVKDILAAAGTRFTDYLYAFFKTSIPHSDQPVLLYSGSLNLNSGVVYNTSGAEASQSIGGGSLGSFVGSNVGSGSLSSRRYKFSEPGYLMDIVSIRPIYAWAGHIPYWNIDNSGSYQFNPKFNRLGYRTVHPLEHGWTTSLPSGSSTITTMKVPFWQEFRSSVDEIHGRMRWQPFSETQNLEAYWVNQRKVGEFGLGGEQNLSFLFCDMANINNIFPVTDLKTDTTYFSAYYDVKCSSYVSKQFATDLSAR